MQSWGSERVMGVRVKRKSWGGDGGMRARSRCHEESGGCGHRAKQASIRGRGRHEGSGAKDGVSNGAWHTSACQPEDEVILLDASLPALVHQSPPQPLDVLDTSRALWLYDDGVRFHGRVPTIIVCPRAPRPGTCSCPCIRAPCPCARRDGNRHPASRRRSGGGEPALPDNRDRHGSTAAASHEHGLAQHGGGREGTDARWRNAAAR